jgi:hypothetical protein
VENLLGVEQRVNFMLTALHDGLKSTLIIIIIIIIIIVSLYMPVPVAARSKA